MYENLRPTSDSNIGRNERLISGLTGGLLIGLAAIKPSRWSLLLGPVGGFLLYRGATGKGPIVQLAGIRRARMRGRNGILVDRSITINRPRVEVYQFWRDLENLPEFMEHLETVEMVVTETDRQLSHWVATAPLGQTVDWNAEITQDQESELIAWKSLPGSQVDTSGVVIFRDAPGDRGTEVHVVMEYNPPGGSAGAVFAKLFREEPDQQINEDLRRLKQILETGAVITVEGQTSGRVKEVKKERKGMENLEVMG